MSYCEKKGFTLKNRNLLNFDYSEPGPRSKWCDISSYFTCRGIWLVLLEPPKAFKQFKGYNCTGTVRNDELLCYPAEAKPLVIEVRQRKWWGWCCCIILASSPFSTTGVAKLPLWPVRRATSPLVFLKHSISLTWLTWERGGFLTENQQLKVCTYFSVA